MARVSLTDDVLGDDDAQVLPATPEPRRSPEARSRARARARAEKRKFTAQLTGEEARELAALAQHVVDELAPDPVGKGWQAEVVRGLVALAAADPELRQRLVGHLTERHGY